MSPTKVSGTVKSGLVAAETYSYKWDIENFFIVQRNPRLLLAQRFPVETKSDEPYHSKFNIGLFQARSSNYVRVGCKLDQILGGATSVCVRFSAKLEDVFECQEIQLLRPGNELLLDHKIFYNWKEPSSCNEYMDSNGTMKLQVRLQVLEPIPSIVEVSDIKLKKY